MKIYTASATEDRAIQWARNNYGNRWKQRVREPIAEGERELRRLYPKDHYYKFAARPFCAMDHITGKPWNVLLQAARHCLRRNEHFRKIAKTMTEQRRTP